MCWSSVTLEPRQPQSSRTTEAAHLEHQLEAPCSCKPPDPLKEAATLVSITTSRTKPVSLTGLHLAVITNPKPVEDPQLLEALFRVFIYSFISSFAEILKVVFAQQQQTSNNPIRLSRSTVGGGGQTNPRTLLFRRQQLNKRAIKGCRQIRLHDAGRQLAAAI